MTGKHYILDGKKIVEVDMATWAKWTEIADRRVEYDEVRGLRVSTVFLGLDHNFSNDGPPILFETMVFNMNDYADLYCRRYATYDEATIGHAETLIKVDEGEIHA